MKINALNNEHINDFIKYCKKHRMEIDDSFLYDEDLENFKVNGENPTYIITDEKGEIKAAASLIIDEYNKSGKRGRFRILHSEIDDIKYYKLLFDEILKHTQDLNQVYIFSPEVNKKLIDAILKLSFSLDRYSFILVREDLPVNEVNLPQGYIIRSCKPVQDDEEAWCIIRNAGFAKLKGSETPITTDYVKNMLANEDNIEGGMQMLYHGKKPVGVVRGSKDEYEGTPAMNIGPLAIIPEYQGKGLGRILLRTILNFAKEHSYKMTYLCVNAENERAKSLYISEGFKQTEAAICYYYELHQK